MKRRHLQFENTLSMIMKIYYYLKGNALEEIKFYYKIFVAIIKIMFQIMQNFYMHTIEKKTVL